MYGHQLAGRLPPFLHSCWVCNFLRPSNPTNGKTEARARDSRSNKEEGDRLGVGVVVGHVDELLIRCFVIVDGEDLSLVRGATV